MALQQSGTVSLTSSAPAPAIGQATHAWTDVAYISFTRRQWSGSISDLLAERLLGCGTVDLVSLDFIATCTAAAQHIKIGCVQAGSNLSIDSATQTKTGFSVVSNAFNAGSRISETIVPQDTLSTQITPIAADRPMIKLMVDISPNVIFTLVIAYRVLGMRTHHLTLN